MDKPATPDYYEALQISPAAQSLIVTKAYRLLAAFYHPDNKETGNPEAFRKVVEAYRVLSDPVRRAAYDHEKFGMFSSSSNGGKPAVREARRATNGGRARAASSVAAGSLQRPPHPAPPSEPAA